MQKSNLIKQKFMQKKKELQSLIIQMIGKENQLTTGERIFLIADSNKIELKLCFLLQMLFLEEIIL